MKIWSVLQFTRLQIHIMYLSFGIKVISNNEVLHEEYDRSVGKKIQTVTEEIIKLVANNNDY